MVALAGAVALAWLAAAPALAEAIPSVDPRYGQIAARCKAQDQPRVWLFKQWHPSPGVDTRAGAETQKLPQLANQTAIYEQLEAWVGAGAVQTVIAEGCSGEMREGFAPQFNGWDLAALRAKKDDASYSSIISSVPLKLEAKFGDRVRTLCGDDESLIKQNNLAFSDARGTVGFLTRIQEHRSNPAKLKLYLDGARQVLKLPASASTDQVTRKLRASVKASLAQARGLIEKRNARVVSQVSAARAGGPDQNVAIVFGGIHADGIVAGLDKLKIPCAVVEPSGYDGNEAALLQRLDELLK